MANRNSSKSGGAGDEVKAVQETYGDIFTGSAAALVAAGIVQQDQLPGQPGMNKYTITLNGHGGHGGRYKDPGPDYLQVGRRGALFRVIKGITKEERERREAERKKQRPTGGPSPD